MSVSTGRLGDEDAVDALTVSTQERVHRQGFVPLRSGGREHGFAVTFPRVEGTSVALTLELRPGAAPAVPERQHIEGVAVSLVLVVEVIPNSNQEDPSDSSQPRMPYRLSNRRQ